LAGKKYGRALEKFKVTQAICGSEIPPCSPRRADLKELSNSINALSSSFAMTPVAETTYVPRVANGEPDRAKPSVCNGLILREQEIRKRLNDDFIPDPYQSVSDDRRFGARMR
jgi:hypothetical protein